jgi:cytochrome c oxidase subunit 1
MVDITPADAVPPAEVAEVELYHPHSWWTKCLPQDIKVIAISIRRRRWGSAWWRWYCPGWVGCNSASRHVQFHHAGAYCSSSPCGMIMVIYLLGPFLGGFGNYPSR